MTYPPENPSEQRFFNHAEPEDRMVYREDQHRDSGDPAAAYDGFVDPLAPLSDAADASDYDPRPEVDSAVGWPADERQSMSPPPDSHTAIAVGYGEPVPEPASPELAPRDSMTEPGDGVTPPGAGELGPAPSPSVQPEPGQTFDRQPADGQPEADGPLSETGGMPGDPAEAGAEPAKYVDYTTPEHDATPEQTAGETPAEWMPRDPGMDAGQSARESAVDESDGIAQQPSSDVPAILESADDGDDGLFAIPQEPAPEREAPVEKKRRGMGEDPAKLRQHELPDPPAAQESGHAVVLAVCNQKGGVGKTTTTINLGAALAEFGRRVLLVDFDPQGALSVGLGIAPHDLDLTIYNLLLERGTNPQDIVMRTRVKGLDLLPANIDLSAAEIQLVNEVAREQTLDRVLRPLLPQYDYILIDCQPSLGLLTVNALTASRGVLIPLECEYFSLRGVALLIDTVEKVRDRLNPDLELEGILATMYDPRTIHAREVFSRIVEAFGDRVFQTTINRTVRFPETTVAGEPITSWAPTSPAAEAYRNLAREILLRDAES